MSARRKAGRGEMDVRCMHGSRNVSSDQARNASNQTVTTSTILVSGTVRDWRRGTIFWVALLDSARLALG
jgi:hypothetical protein